jgi:hypothetical protein
MIRGRARAIRLPAPAVVLAHRPAAEVTHRRQAVFVSYRDKVIDTVLGLRRRASRLD